MEIVLGILFLVVVAGVVHTFARYIDAKELIQRFEKLRPLARCSLHYETRLETLLEMAREDLLCFWHLQGFDSHEAQCKQLFELERELNDRATKLRH